MDKVIFNDKVISDWMEYIILKFSDQNYFEIDQEEGRDYILVKSKTNKTKIWFHEVDPSGLSISDCQYGNDDCKGWSGESAAVNSDKYGIFNQDNLNNIDNLLDVPIYEGWTSVDYYLGSTFYKAKSYEGKDKKDLILNYHGSELGCISILLFPIFIVINILMNYELLGTKKEIYIHPIISS